MTIKYLEYPCGCAMFVEVIYNPNAKAYGWRVDEDGLQFNPCPEHQRILEQSTNKYK